MKEDDDEDVSEPEPEPEAKKIEKIEEPKVSKAAASGAVPIIALESVK